MPRRTEANDIVHLLLPNLRSRGFNLDNVKVDTTTPSTGSKRGDVWISTRPQTDSGFNTHIIGLIEAKYHRVAIGDREWNDARRQGKEKASRQHLTYYCVTDCNSLFRYYAVDTDADITLDGRPVSSPPSPELLSQMLAQVRDGSAEIRTEPVVAPARVSETDFKSTLQQLSQVYRSAHINRKEWVDNTVSLVVLKYISEKESFQRTLPRGVELWNDVVRSSREDQTYDVASRFRSIISQIWENSEYQPNEYSSFKDLVTVSPRLNNLHMRKLVDALDAYHLHGAEFDLFGSVYEAYASQEKKREFGQYYTRRHITRIASELLLAQELQPRPLRLCDPACGTGGFLTEAFHVLTEHYLASQHLNSETRRRLKEDTFFGYDADEHSVARTKLNMFLVGDGHTHIYERDSLDHFDLGAGFVASSFDYVLTNPPMGSYVGDAVSAGFTFTNKSRFELLFTERVISLTKPGGEIVIVLNDGTLEAPSNRGFREKLLAHCYVTAVVSLTRFAFAPYTKEKTYLVFLRRRDANDSDQSYPIWMYIVDYDGYANSDKRYRTEDRNDLPELKRLFPEACRLALQSLHEPDSFVRSRAGFERALNAMEVTDGFTGAKSAFVSIDTVKSDPYLNLQCEHYLRPALDNQITLEEYDRRLRAILDETDVVLGQARNLFS